MLDSVAFQSGVIVAVATSLYSWIHWVLASKFNIRIEQVGILYSPFFNIYKKKVNSIELFLGWLPTGSFVKIYGVVDETEENEVSIPKEHEFRGKSFWTKFIVLFSSPILFILIGSLLLNFNSNVNFGKIVETYFKVSIYLASIDEGVEIWNELFLIQRCLIGFIVFVMGVSSLFSNFPTIFVLNSKNSTITALLFILLSIILSLILVRLSWQNFEFINIIYFYIGSIVTAGFTYLISLFLATKIPNH